MTALKRGEMQLWGILVSLWLLRVRLRTARLMPRIVRMLKL
jgi:hypothetical protein